MTTLSGIDISQHQSVTPALGGLQYVVARASIGTVKDTRYDTHSAAVRAAGIPLGAYHFNWKDVDAATQARFFLSIAKDADFLALDVEGAEAFSLAQQQAFIAEIHNAGRKIGMYHSDSGFPAAGQDWDWVAKWGGVAPTRSWALWQYADTAADGVTPLDRDKFNGDSAAFAAFLASQKGTADMLAVLTVNPLAAPNPRRWIAPAGTVIKGYDPARPGIVTFQGTVPAGSGLTGTADATGLIDWPGDTTPPIPHGGPFIHVVSNVLWPQLNQQWVRDGLTLDAAAPAPTTGIPQDQLDAANAKIAALTTQVANDQAALDKAAADLAAAPAAERERIAQAASVAEANRVLSL